MSVDDMIQSALSAITNNPSDMGPILDAPATMWAHLVAHPDNRWRTLASKLWLWLEWDRQSMYPLVMDTIDHQCTIRETLGRASQVYFKVSGWEYDAENNTWRRRPPSVLAEDMLEGSESVASMLKRRPEAERVLYAHVVSGLSTFPALKDITGWPPSTLSKRLAKLVEVGAIRRTDDDHQGVRWTVR